LAVGGLVLSGNTLYGTAQIGGRSGNGSVFAVSTDGTGLRTCIVLRTATELIRLLLGFVEQHTIWDGRVWRQHATWHGVAVNTNSTGFTTLQNFDGSGGEPLAGLILSDNTLYGTAQNGGGSDSGSVLPSTLIAPVLRIFMVSPQRLLLLRTATERFPMPDWFYRATHCMELHIVAAVRAMAQFLP